MHNNDLPEAAAPGNVEKNVEALFFRGEAKGPANSCCMRVRVFYFMRLYKLWLLEKQSHVSHTAQLSAIQFQLACALRYMFIYMC